MEKVNGLTMNGNQRELSEELPESLADLDPSSSSEVAFPRLRINGCALSATYASLSLAMGSSYVNGFCEPHSAGSSSSATVSETKKMGKFKFLTVTSNENCPENANDSNMDASRHLSPSDDHVLRTPSPTRKPSFSSSSSSVLPDESSFAMPGSLSGMLDHQSPRKSREETFIDKQVQLLLEKVTIPVTADDEVEEEDEDDDFDSRLEQMIAAEEKTKKGKRRKNNNKANVMMNTGRRKYTRKKKGDEAPPELKVIQAIEIPMVNGKSLLKPKMSVELNEINLIRNVESKPVKTQEPKSSRGRKHSTITRRPAVDELLPSHQLELIKTETATLSISDDTASQFSEIENRESEEPGDVSPRKLKSRWVEKVSTVPLAVQEENIVEPSVLPSSDDVEMEPVSESTSNRPYATSSSKTPVLEDEIITDEPPPQYDLITECIRLSRYEFKEDREARKMRCDCTYTSEDLEMGIKGCPEGCMNRMLYIECGPKCHAKDMCSNKRFQRKEYAPIEAFKTRMKGWGIRATQPLGAGQFICEYVGEILDGRQFKKRQRVYEKENIQHHYFMALNNEEVIDATRKGNVTRFTNHSCDPNCETQKWTVGGQLRVGFFTIRPLAAGEEIVFDYQFERYGETAQKCYCGAAKCRGFIDSVQEEKKKSSRLEVGDRKLASEIDRFVQNGVLRTADQALRMARLLLRVEEDQDRLILLRVLQNSERNTEALRSFLRYQGLTVMADAMYSCRNSSSELKMEILHTLQVLPITAKNSLLDSKVWATLERWAGRDTSKEAAPATATPAVAAKTSSRDQSHESTPVKQEPGDSLKSAAVPSDKPPELSLDKVDSPKSAAENLETEAGEDKKRPSEDKEESMEAFACQLLGRPVEEDVVVRKVAGELLDKWEGLKVLYKIPKKIAETAPVEEPKKFPQAFQPPKMVMQRSENGASIPTLSWGRQSFLNRFRQRSPSPPPPTADAELRRPIKRTRFGPDERESCAVHENRFSNHRQHRIDRFGFTRRFDDDRPKCKVHDGEEMDLDLEDDVPPQFAGPHRFHLPAQEPCPVHPHQSMPPPQMGVPFAVFPPPQFRVPPPGMVVPLGGPVVESPEQAAARARYEAMVRVKVELIKKDMAIAAHQVSHRLLSNQIPTNQKVDVMTPDGSLQDARTYKPTVEEATVMRATLPEVGSSDWTEKADLISSRTGLAVEAVEAPVARDVTGWTCNFDVTKITTLPRNWAAAYDRIGRLYFYNTITGVSRWDYPVEDRTYSTALQQISTNLSVPSDLEDFSLLPEATVDLNAWARPLQAAVPAEPRRPSEPVPATEEQKRFLKTRQLSSLKRRKVDFQNDVCQYILQLLNSYRSPQCTQGRIEWKEDFKFLARKFTHNVVEQEIQRHKRNPEALKFSSRHKPKIKEHIKKYMSRFGKVYRKDPKKDDEPAENKAEEEDENIDDENDDDVDESLEKETPGNDLFSPENSGFLSSNSGVDVRPAADESTGNPGRSSGNSDAFSQDSGISNEKFEEPSNEGEIAGD